ncbi:hypothetical protein QMZ92_14970 [Streptomyces sp. HNM0645]|uniref:hypothetical protein n=1 Tax=Streptomyces sp. HNM0645 TaxID=2782343 RepID=UPI0024B6E8D8|nr:hypothetical protein [Streptomyces sp. HNM0645]MDI9885649.1 hypothetical protein [Streptomyces sp. HNM0645]
MASTTSRVASEPAAGIAVPVLPAVYARSEAHGVEIVAVSRCVRIPDSVIPLFGRP